jgi:hypothetical protein
LYFIEIGGYTSNFSGIKIHLGLVQFPKIPKNFQDFLSHRIFGRIHEALNIDENKNLIL